MVNAFGKAGDGCESAARNAAKKKKKKTKKK